MPLEETIRVKLEVVSDQAVKGFGSARKAVNKFGPAAVAAASAAGASFAKLAQSVADATNALNDAAVRTGVSAKTLAGLKLAAEGAGLSLGEMEAALRPFPKRLQDAQRGTGEALIAFEALGVSVTNADGSLRSADSVLKDVTGKLQRVSSPTEQAALATSAFGEAGGALMQALGDTSLGTFTDKAASFGLDIGPSASSAAADWQRAMADLKLIIEGTVAAMVPLDTATKQLQNFTVGLTFLTTKVGGLLSGMSATEAHTAAVQKAFRLWQTQNEDTEKSAEELTVDVNELRNRTDQLKLATAAHAAAERERAKAIADAAAAADASLDSFVALRLELAAEGNAEEQIRQQERKRLAVIAEHRQAELALLRDQVAQGIITEQAAAEERVLIEQQAQAAIAEVQQSAADQRNELLEAQREAYRDQMAQWREEDEKDSDDSTEKIKEGAGKKAEDILHVAGASLQALDSLVGGTLERAVNFEGVMTERRKRMARQAFAAQKAISLSTAAVNTAVAVTSALATPPFPLGLALAVVAGAQGAVQLGMIAAQQPSFHIGSRSGDLAPDETNATLTRRETVLTPLAIADLNAGAGVDAGGMVLQMGTDFFDVGVKQSMKRNRHAIPGRSRVGHRKRR